MHVEISKSGFNNQLARMREARKIAHGIVNIEHEHIGKAPGLLEIRLGDVGFAEQTTRPQIDMPPPDPLPSANSAPPRKLAYPVS